MTTYIVSANGMTLGTFEAASEQEARDLCAQDAGYQSEAEMVTRLEQPSELVAAPASYIERQSGDVEEA